MYVCAYAVAYVRGYVRVCVYVCRDVRVYLLMFYAGRHTVKIVCKRLPYLGATELHPIWVNFNPDICVPR